MQFSSEFKEFLQLLADNKVKYLIVGGYALAIHGHPRFTGDLDIWISPTAQNAQNVLKAIEAFGFGDLDISPNDLTQPAFVIQLGYPPQRIDLLTGIDGVQWDEAFANGQHCQYDGVNVTVISLDDLKKNKKASGRLQDLADLEKLSD